MPVSSKKLWAPLMKLSTLCFFFVSPLQFIATEYNLILMRYNVAVIEYQKIKFEICANVFYPYKVKCVHVIVYSKSAYALWLYFWCHIDSFIKYIFIERQSDYVKNILSWILIDLSSLPNWICDLRQSLNICRNEGPSSDWRHWLHVPYDSLQL